MASSKKSAICLPNWFAVLFILILFVSTIVGCAGVHKRNPVPENKATIAHIPGIQYGRMWGDMLPDDTDQRLANLKAQIELNAPQTPNRPLDYLALSGGGANGAFGAGLLAGWSEKGDRPVFHIVTGISTGALIAPFAFLGPAYDAQLKQAYTTISTKDILKRRGVIKILTGDAVADTSPFKDQLIKYITPAMLREIAAEYKLGRRLFIGTTNLDAKRPVIWNIGAIASSGHPQALDLVHRIILASASIPGVFPPVYIEVQADGQRYDEMHVDGGTTSQVFLYPGKFDYAYVKKELGLTSNARAFVIRNSRLEMDWKAVEPTLKSIGLESISALIMTQGFGDLYRIYFGTQRDGIEYNLAYIPDTFKMEPNEPFDQTYMQHLFDLGYRLAVNGYPWEKSPPVFFQEGARK